MTQQDKDVETVKRAADGQKVAKAQAELGRLTDEVEAAGSDRHRQRRKYKAELEKAGMTRDEVQVMLQDFDKAWNEQEQLDAQQFVSNLPECLCEEPTPSSMGPPVSRSGVAYCLTCGKRVGDSASRKLIQARQPVVEQTWETHDGRIVQLSEDPEYDAVQPPHYQRGPRVMLGEYDTAEFYDIQCMDVMRCMQDPRLATAFKYIWRVAFGGKSEPWDSRTPQEVDARDINSAIWYLQDYLANPPQALADPGQGAYTSHAVGRAEKKD